MIGVIVGGVVVGLVYRVCAQVQSILNACITSERISEAETILTIYESAYNRIANLAASRYLRSSRQIEHGLLFVFHLLQQKRTLLEECKYLSKSTLLDHRQRKKVMRRLNRAFFLENRGYWKQIVNTQLEKIVLILSQDAAPGDNTLLRVGIREQSHS